MRRKFFSTFAGVVSFLMIGAMTADAAEITFGGRIRPRYELWNIDRAGKAANSDAFDSQEINMMVRLQALAKIDDKTSAFIQLQSVSRFGADSDNAFGAVGGVGGTPNQPNDTTTDVGIHQAYFDLKNFFDSTVDLRIGRQEIILDGHRLFGNTVWTQGMQSHDALMLNHSHDNMTLKLFWSKASEQTNLSQAGGVFGAGASSDDVDDQDVVAFWANWKGLLGANSSTSAYVVYTDQDCNNPTVTAASAPSTVTGCGGAIAGGTINKGSADFWTIGARQAGGQGDFTYRGEFYYQGGKANTVNAVGQSGDLSAFMIGLRGGWKAKNVPMKPSITLWYDYLSGSSGSDLAAGDQGDFRTLYDTGHKYYGLMDLFLASPTNNGPTHPRGGLIDYAIKVSVQPAAKTTFKVDYHNFAVAEDDACGSCTINGTNPSTLGQEIDLTLVHKYSPSTTISAGYSHFFARDLLGFYNGGAGSAVVPRTQGMNDQDWLYVMFDVMF